MRNSEYRANQDLAATPRRRVNPQWLPPRTYVGLVDVLFVGAAFITALWFVIEYGGEVWTWLSAVIGVG